MSNPEPIPFVHYYCDCPDFTSYSDSHNGRRSIEPSVKKDTSFEEKSQFLTVNDPIHLSRSSSTGTDVGASSTTATVTGQHLLSAQASNYVYPLSRLYFCEDCHQIRCPSCVQDEIVSYYCPNCLFEVPTASVKSEKNRCARNCFQCPICQNTLSVVAAQESATVPAAAGPYFLACNVCRWNSQEIGMTFEKPTSLALQLQKNEEALPDAKEFDHLKEHFEKYLRANAPPALPTSFMSFSNTGAFNKMMGGQFSGDTQAQGKKDVIEPYVPSVQILDDDTKTLNSMFISTLSQRFTQLHDQPYQLSKIHPQRIHLCIKRSKRCRTCRHILIKPEQKAQATRFKIKLVAMNYIPNITIVKMPRKPWLLQLGVPTQFVLKFTNPLYEEMSITLATPQMRRKSATDSEGPQIPEKTNTKMMGKVTILSPHFTVGAYNETIEYDDELYSNGSTRKASYGGTAGISSGGGASAGGASAGWSSGVYDRRNNYTSVVVEVVPEQYGEFKFPLLVTYHYKADDGRMDVSSGDIEMDLDDIDPDDSFSGSKKANSSIRMDDDRTKSLSFWCLIGLGQVSGDPENRPLGESFHH
ncbi:hypothetical protein PHYBLDRAFT_182467 [Phycomyces blakesleeanus NRRL 1555(-)]|uniref:Dynactin subunit 4 n=1 Tax=Phycomyces blakesleeanus (strain ATCC 8743b / DSM 1359 / FGSC 10004 / NBRC 33097 / NRRL 1555) TaxID=763407 RepID=A0A163DEF0_PHYB8|nr:hypothetical protein PHYBLDRAFT_182467 [Phycomyces blakesleeanus NRRL 1555(-)]OAD70690.1 hypothetical protein PHYBLDRAFT_182467 [Phycomyces blakesleeanus NRRL 1555(-)]|eukprot:XP_018288730.1 hypothetical protein PHYBLDRAFT_182467 [Phycomyces blakesleeanus NRRL 1555(-)]